MGPRRRRVEARRRVSGIRVGAVTGASRRRVVAVWQGAASGTNLG